MNRHILLIDPDSVYSAHEVTRNGFTRLGKLSKLVRQMLSATDRDDTRLRLDVFRQNMCLALALLLKQKTLGKGNFWINIGNEINIGDGE